MRLLYERQVLLKHLILWGGFTECLLCVWPCMGGLGLTETQADSVLGFGELSVSFLGSWFPVPLSAQRAYLLYTILSLWEMQQAGFPLL